jgi:hypothetical protein
MTQDGRWVYARDLQVDDVVRSHSFGTQKISALESSLTQTLVYNFLTDDLHNYAVGQDGILVHNVNTRINTEKPQRTGAGKSDPHGDGGRAKAKVEVKKLEIIKEIERLKKSQEPGKAKRIGELKVKLQHMQKIAEKARKGETHWRN